MTHSSCAVQARYCTNNASPKVAVGDARTNAATSTALAADLDALVRGYLLSVIRAGFITRQDLAHYSGLSRSGLTQWLNGRRTMKLENASRLVSLFGLERFIQYLVRQSQAQEVPSPDLLTLLQQINVVLRSLVEETLGIRVDETDDEGGAGKHQRRRLSGQDGPEAVVSPREQSVTTTNQTMENKNV